MKKIVVILALLVVLSCSGVREQRSLTVEKVAPGTFPGKGLAGYATTAQLNEQGATWFHSWQLCRAGWDSRCINHVKSSYGMIEKGDTIQMLSAALETCQNGWIMFGDEWEYQGMAVGRQIAELYWFLQIRDLVNPDCNVVFGGELIYVPNRPDVGPVWVHLFWDAYEEEYGAPPDVQAVMIDAYDFTFFDPTSLDYVQQVRDMVAAIHQEAGNVPVWGREVGSLVEVDNCPAKAMSKLRPLVLDGTLAKIGWFIANNEPMWWYTALYDQNGVITTLGRGYRAFPISPSSYVPVVMKP